MNATMGTLVVVTIAQVSVIDARECSERAYLVASMALFFLVFPTDIAIPSVYVIPNNIWVNQLRVQSRACALFHTTALARNSYVVAFPIILS